MEELCKTNEESVTVVQQGAEADSESGLQSGTKWSLRHWFWYWYFCAWWCCALHLVGQMRLKCPQRSRTVENLREPYSINSKAISGGILLEWWIQANLASEVVWQTSLYSLLSWDYVKRLRIFWSLLKFCRCLLLCENWFQNVSTFFIRQFNLLYKEGEWKNQPLLLSIYKFSSLYPLYLSYLFCLFVLIPLCNHVVKPSRILFRSLNFLFEVEMWVV